MQIDPYLAKWDFVSKLTQNPEGKNQLNDSDQVQKETKEKENGDSGIRSSQCKGVRKRRENSRSETWVWHGSVCVEASCTSPRR